MLICDVSRLRMARKDAEKLCLQWMNDLDPSGVNTARWAAKFKNMDDDTFKKFVGQLRSRQDYISMVSPNFKDKSITTENNFKVAKKYGVKLFQRLWLTDPVTGIRYLSHDEYPVFYLPVRRQIQMARNKMSYAKDNAKSDALTGQPVGESEGGAISYPEILVLNSRGLNKTTEELIYVRGGNAGSFRASNKLIRETGSVSLKELEANSTGVKSTQVLNTLFKAAHIDNNI